MIDLRLSPAPPHQEELPSVLADIVDFARHSWSRAQLSGRDHDILHDRGGPRAPSGTAGGQIQSQIQHTQLHGNNKSWPFSVLFLVLCMVIVVFSVFRSYLSRAEDSKTRRHLWGRLQEQVCMDEAGVIRSYGRCAIFYNNSIVKNTHCIRLPTPVIWSRQ